MSGEVEWFRRCPAGGTVFARPDTSAESVELPPLPEGGEEGDGS